MKKSVNFFILLALIFTTNIMRAHQPDLSSTMLVERENNVWVLQIRAALTGFEYEVKTHFGDDSFATPEEFQALVLKHVQENLIIKTNHGEPLVLENGSVKLGHETSVIYEVIGMPDKLEEIEVTNSSFRDISRNQSALIILKNGVSKKQFVMDRKNDHTVALRLHDDKFELLTPEVKVSSINSNSKFKYLGALAVGILIVFLIFFNRSKQNSTQGI